MMTKTTFEHRLSDYVRGELSTEETRAMEEYLHRHPAAVALEQRFRALLIFTKYIREDSPPQGLLEAAEVDLLKQIHSVEQPLQPNRQIPLLPRRSLPRLFHPAYSVGLAVLLLIAVMSLLWRGTPSLVLAEVIGEIQQLHSFRVAGWIRGEDGAQTPYRQWLQGPGFFRAEIGAGAQQRVVISDGTWRLIQDHSGTIYRERVSESEVRSIEDAVVRLYLPEEQRLKETAYQVSQEDKGQRVRFTIWPFTSLGRSPSDLKLQVEVDRKTRLPVQSVVYQQSSGSWQAISELRYMDYNVPFPQGLFRMPASERARAPAGKASDALWFERSITPMFALFPASYVPPGGVEVTLLTPSTDPAKGSSGWSRRTMGGVVTWEFHQCLFPDIVHSLTDMAVETQDDTIRQQRLSLEVVYKQTLPWPHRIDPLCRMFGIQTELISRRAMKTRFVFTQDGRDFPLSARHWGAPRETVRVGTSHEYTYERAALEVVIRRLFANSLRTGFNRDIDTLAFRWDGVPEQNPFTRKVDLGLTSSGDWTANLQHLHDQFGVQVERVAEPVTCPALILQPDLPLRTNPPPAPSRTRDNR